MLSLIVLIAVVAVAFAEHASGHAKRMLAARNGLEMKQYSGSDSMNIITGTTHYDSLCSRGTSIGYYAIGGPNYCQQSKDNDGNTISTRMGCTNPNEYGSFDLKFVSYKGEGCTGTPIGEQSTVMSSADCNLGDNDDNSPFETYARMTCDTTAPADREPVAGMSVMQYPLGSKCDVPPFMASGVLEGACIASANDGVSTNTSVIISCNSADPTSFTVNAFKGEGCFGVPTQTTTGKVANSGECSADATTVTKAVCNHA